ncbi:glycosyltransferase family protein [Paenibacillus lautus]|uniref:hypothetical protein n=1 Tax=Paenibacillus lautus TaxID=1401 RepID=UPI002DB9CB52|nr:hypothetical protein [Paenibacillus lautus]MEC0258401.1 hypothetical protein [Paenibacillus lautus]
MDDFLGFFSGFDGIRRLKQLEVGLMKRADVVFTSSSYLREKMKSIYRFELKDPPNLVNNGISSTLFERGGNGNFGNIGVLKTGGFLNIMYMGTVGEWIDFDIIINILREKPNVKFTIIGPIDTKVPRHSRINYVGPVEHNQLPDYALLADALIMPFRLNELVRSVDPVKIYEYIFFQKPVFAINYKEMHKFLPFVTLYSNKEELLQLVEDLQDGKAEVHSKAEIITFLKQNTWDVRCKQIVSILEGDST